MTAPAIAKVVRTDDQTVRNWFKRWMAEGIEGLKDRPMPGGPAKVTKAYKEQLLTTVRCRPRALSQPYSMWTHQRLANYMAEQTGIRVSYETIRRVLACGTQASPAFSHHASVPSPFRVQVRCWINNITPVVSLSSGNVSCTSQGAPPCLCLSHRPRRSVTSATTLVTLYPYSSRRLGQPQVASKNLSSCSRCPLRRFPFHTGRLRQKLCRKIVAFPTMSNTGDSTVSCGLPHFRLDWASDNQSSPYTTYLIGLWPLVLGLHRPC